jgi:uncharacterized protein (DUF433 family)
MGHKWNFGTPEEKYKRMIVDYRNGMSIEDMKIKYDYSSDSAVRNVLRKQGEMAEAPGRVKEKPLDIPKVMELMRAQWPIEEIVKEFDGRFTAEQIRKAVREWRG